MYLPEAWNSFNKADVFLWIVNYKTHPEEKQDYESILNISQIGSTFTYIHYKL